MLIVPEREIADLMTRNAAFDAVEGVFAAMASKNAENFPVVREAIGHEDALYGFKGGFDKAGMALGVVVDDSVHFLSKYQIARRELKLSAHDAVISAFNGVGTALVVTTLILTAGFAILAQSTFGVNSYMAMLTGIALVIALIADMTLLPALLIALDKNKKDTAPVMGALEMGVKEAPQNT